MKRICQIFLGLLFCIDSCGAVTARTSNSVVRQNTPNLTARKTTNRSKPNIINRSAVSRTTPNQNSTIKTVSARSAVNTKTIPTRSTTSTRRLSRTAITAPVSTQFENNYTACRDAYFTCMDQFCANQDETYRRCVCSPKLQKIQSNENALNQTASDLADFHLYNIDAISKTAAEINAMQNATIGEQNLKEDTSSSAKKLHSIQEVLNNAKQKGNSFESSYDISTGIESVWGTTGLIQGYNVATLYGEALYNAVSSQCYDLTAKQCTASDLKLIASAYSMYIENDCELLKTNTDLKIKQANADIRSTRQEMQKARLDNYNALNSLSINDCITKIKEDITADIACGPGYIHCLDFTGKYINITTGEPIYSPDFYQFENQMSLSGDLLKNVKNKNIINLLNTKQKFAKQTLDSCNTVADDVWEEFLQQAIVEIFQAQQQRINTVKQDCINVVNQCISNTINNLKNYISSTTLITTQQTLQLTTQLCQKEISTCANVYGGNDTLVSAITSIQNNYVSPECATTLDTFVQSLCSVPTNNPYHSYPYGCRIYNKNSCQSECSGSSDSLYDRIYNYAKIQCLYTKEEQQDSTQETAVTLYVVQTLNKVRIALIAELSKECERLDDGTWVDIPRVDNNYDNIHDITGDVLSETFMLQTDTDASWGYCKQKPEND